MKIDIETIVEAQKVLDNFNKLKLTDIEFYKNGLKIEIPKQALDEWKFVGLSNSYFVKLNQETL